MYERVRRTSTTEPFMNKENGDYQLNGLIKKDMAESAQLLDDLVI